MNKKLLLSTAIAAALGASMSAHAEINLDDDTGSLTFASELDVSGGVTLEEAVAGDQDANVANGFGASAGENRFFRFDLTEDSGATFAVGSTLALTLDTLGGTVASGGAGENFVIFSYEADATDGFTADQRIVFDVNNIDVTSQDAVTISFAHYDTPGDASNETNALKTADAPMFSFDAALATSVTSVTPEKINVQQDSLFFDGETKDNGGTGSDNATVIGNVEVGVDGTTLWNDGEAAEMVDLADMGSGVRVTGTFSALEFDANDNLTAGDIQLNTATDCAGTATSADTISASEAFFLTDTGAFDSFICYVVSGTSEITEGDISGEYDVVAAGNAVTSDQNLGVLSTLEKNGSEDNVSFAGATSAWFYRVSNPTTVKGNVFFTVWDRTGANSCNFDLSDIDGIDSNELAANSGSLLFTGDKIIGAVGTGCAIDFDATAGKQVRLRATGEFGSTAVQTGSGSEVGIRLEAWADSPLNPQR